MGIVVRCSLGYITIRFRGCLPRTFRVTIYESLLLGLTSPPTIGVSVHVLPGLSSVARVLHKWVSCSLGVHLVFPTTVLSGYSTSSGSITGSTDVSRVRGG